MTGIRVQACLHQQHQWASCTSVCFSLSSGFISSQSLGVLLKIAGWTINTFHGAMDRCTTTTSSSTVVSCTQVDDAVVPWLYVDDAVSTSCVEASGLLRIYATNTSTKKLL